MVYFYLNGKRKDFTGLLGGQVYKNGVCAVDENDADLVARIQCRYYGAIRSNKSPEELRATKDGGNK